MELSHDEIFKTVDRAYKVTRDYAKVAKELKENGNPQSKMFAKILSKMAYDYNRQYDMIAKFISDNNLISEYNTYKRGF